MGRLLSGIPSALPIWRAVISGSLSESESQSQSEIEKTGGTYPGWFLLRADRDIDCDPDSDTDADDFG